MNRENSTPDLADCCRQCGMTYEQAGIAWHGIYPDLLPIQRVTS